MKAPRYSQVAGRPVALREPRAAGDLLQHRRL